MTSGQEMERVYSYNPEPARGWVSGQGDRLAPIEPRSHPTGTHMSHWCAHESLVPTLVTGAHISHWCPHESLVSLVLTLVTGTHMSHWYPHESLVCT